MKTNTRRSFFKMFVRSLIGLLALNLNLSQKIVYKDLPLEEADLYKKHNLAG